jgi:hypothetical protein
MRCSSAISKSMTPPEAAFLVVVRPCQAGR